MSLDFFKNSCQEIPENKREFGIRDDIPNSKAYLDISNPDLWGATVKNHDEFDIVFTAVDKCVINDNEYEERGRCDGMLTTEKHLFLVELKDKSKTNKTEILKQLTDTVEFLYKFHETELKNFKHKKVFGCNKRHSKFQTIDNEQQKKYFAKYKFRIDVQGEIIII